MTISHDLAYDLLTELVSPATESESQGSVLAPPATIGEVQPLGETDRISPQHDLAQTLVARRSTRFFSGQSVPVQLLTQLLTDALQEARSEIADLEAYVVAWRVDGLPPAIHRFDPGSGYHPVMELPTGDDRHGLTLQPEFSDAAVIVSFALPLDSATATHGAHGYRRLMVQTSSTAYAMWLDAVAHGLVGSVFAGFLPAAVRRPLRSDGTSRIQAFALALGHPAPKPSSAAAGE